METTQPQPTALQKLCANTALLRPLPLQRKTGKAVLALALASAILAVIFAILKGDKGAALFTPAMLGFFGSYGVWALTQELTPKDHVTPFFSMPGALWVIYTGREISLLMLFSALFLVRIVNRSDGRSATFLDSIVACAFLLYAMIITENMLFWFAGFIAFSLDAILKERAHRQWLFAAACTGVGLNFNVKHIELMRELAFATLPRWSRWLLLALLVNFVLGLLRKPSTQPTHQASQSPSRGRFRASVVVAILCALLPLFQGYLGLLGSSLIWSALTTSAAIGLIVFLIQHRMSPIQPQESPPIR